MGSGLRMPSGRAPQAHARVHVFGCSDKKEKPEHKAHLPGTSVRGNLQAKWALIYGTGYVTDE